MPMYILVETVGAEPLTPVRLFTNNGAQALDEQEIRFTNSNYDRSVLYDVSSIGDMLKLRSLVRRRCQIEDCTFSAITDEAMQQHYANSMHGTEDDWGQ